MPPRRLWSRGPIVTITRGWPQFISAIATTVLLGFVAIYTPSYLVGAFNPVVMNGASVALSIVALLALRSVSSSSD